MFKNVNYQLSTINRVLGCGIKRFVCFDGQRDVNWELRTAPQPPLGGGRAKNLKLN